MKLRTQNAIAVSARNLLAFRLATESFALHCGFYLLLISGCLCATLATSLILSPLTILFTNENMSKLKHT